MPAVVKNDILTHLSHASAEAAAAPTFLRASEMRVGLGVLG